MWERLAIMIGIPEGIILVLILGIFFVIKKFVEKQNELEHFRLLNQKYLADVNRVKSDAREHTTQIITKTTEKNVKQSMLFLKIKKIVSSLDPHDICSSVFDLLHKELGVKKACILLLDSKTQNFSILSSLGFNAGEDHDIFINKHEQSLVGLAIRSNITVDINSVEKEQTFSRLIGKGMVKTIMASPVHHSKSSEIMAVLNICDMENINYSNEEKNLFNMVTSLLEVALNNSLVYENQIEVSEQMSKETEKVKDIFGRYVSAQIMSEILNDPDALELGGVNKKVTILASDIRSFTKMSEKLPPQEMVSMLNDYFSVMTEIVNMNHGCVDKFIGDALMVLFGAPIAKTEDCFNSIRCAIEMQDAIKIFEEKWRETKGPDWQFKIGIGINVGDVVIGNIGSSSRMEYTAIGDNVNVAFRLESIAPGGTTLITESLYSEVSDRVIVEKLEPTTVKGRSQPVHVYKVIGLK